MGSYYLENDKGESNLGKLKKIVDGEWEAWGTFGPCSKTCISGDETPGIMTSHRDCKPPQNGGLNCKGNTSKERQCAHLPGDDGERFRQCPIDAKWSSWSPNWSQCNSNCLNEGQRTPFRSRTRVCHPGQYGGKDCSFIEDQAKQKKEPLYTEEQNCTELPKCPKAASMGPWSSWSTCSGTCFPESQATPQTSRTRSCIESVLSSDSTLNEDVATCEALGDQRMYKNCPNIAACPVAPVWNDWGDWTTCTSSCGSEGERTRSRSFVPGRHGGLPKPQGKETEKGPCNGDVPCPVPATFKWSNWSSCDIECYRSDSYRGMRTRRNNCTEGNPRHPHLNCEYPPGGHEQTERTCPNIGQCYSLTKIQAYILEGTDGWVWLKLKNRGTNEECTTSGLDSAGNSWASYSWDTYTNKYGELNHCKNFYPSPNKLQFNLKVNRSLKLQKIFIVFHNKVYMWYGRRVFKWANRNDWVDISLA